MKSHMLCPALSAVALSAAAQEAKPTRPDDPSAVVPSVVYESAFQGYTKYREETLRPWRELNDEAARAGGHARIVGDSVHEHGKRPPSSSSHPAKMSAPADEKTLNARPADASSSGAQQHQGH